MSSRARRALLTLAALGGAITLATAPGPAAAAGSPTAAGSPCSNVDDITVVVDFQSLGGGVKVGCAAQPVKTGFEALEKAGFQVTSVTNIGGVLCQIDAKPSTSDCGKMPPATAYWSYWIASRGGDWCYSNQGAMRKPPRGTVEGWSFSSGASGESANPEPGYGPPAAIPGTTPNTLGRASCPSEPTTTTTRPTAGTQPTPITTAPTLPGGAPAPTTTTTRRSDGSDGSTVTTGATGASPEAGGDSTTSSSSAGDSTTSSSTAGGGSTDEQAAGDLTTKDRDSGSPLGAVVGVGGVIALGGAAAVTSLRRRRAEADPTDLPEL